jgi:Acetyl-coenzyme A synthetase N-terminus
MSEMRYKVAGSWSASAHVNDSRYHEMYTQSVRDPERFWGEHGKRLDWINPYTWVKRTSFAPCNVSIEWFGDGTTNVSLNCIDRHLPSAPIRLPLSGKVMIPASPRASPTGSCTMRCAALPMC